jgi:hypothetical protein
MVATHEIAHGLDSKAGHYVGGRRANTIPVSRTRLGALVTLQYFAVSDCSVLTPSERRHLADGLRAARREIRARRQLYPSAIP